MGGTLDVIVVAAGSGRRMGFDKILAQLAGRPVLAWSLGVFEEAGVVGRVVVVCASGARAEVGKIAGAFGKVAGVVVGGAQRPDSVLAGAEALEGMGVDVRRMVAVHDAARPLVLRGVIETCLEAARLHGAAAPAERVADTLHRTDNSQMVTDTVVRENLWRVQTPQVLPLGTLLELAGGRGFTDEVSALRAAHKPVALVENPAPNFKITVPADLETAGAILRARNP
jgi:2-C-methyl-D-erythritol 4-phosphate cytidylyltransferase